MVCPRLLPLWVSSKLRAIHFNLVGESVTVKDDEIEAPDFLASSFHQRYLKLTVAQRIEYLRCSDETSAIIAEACQPPLCYGFEALDEQSRLYERLVQLCLTRAFIFIACVFH